MSGTQQQIKDTFIELAERLVTDYDIIDFLDTLARRIVDLLDVTACGLVLADHHDTLNLVAASNEQARLLELFQLQNAEGPCLECYRAGEPVICADLTGAEHRWPLFAPRAHDAGFAAVHALPMRLGDTVLGAINLFNAEPGPLEPDAVALGQAMADVATIGIVHERTIRHYEIVTEQLQTALNSRILIEQAKGVLAERLHISVNDAFHALRAHARASNRKLRDVAAAVVEGTVEVTPSTQASTEPT
jgi:transcriptional regulator with GAF, ATPase, and Fis domain